MSFLLPAALWFAAALPVIVFFYLLKRRRTRFPVSSTVLWRRYLAEMQASAPFQRLRHHWQLVLQLLLTALLVFALTRPFLPGSEQPSSLRILVLDASASMQSTDVRPSRFEAARAEARNWADGLAPGQSIVVLQAGSRTEVLQSATTDRPLLRQALDRARVTDGTARIGDALRMAESLIRDVPDAEIHLFSDGAVGNLDEFANRNLPLVYHRFGVRRENVAIGALEVRANPEDPRQRAVFTSLVNLSSAALQTTMELRFDGDLVDVQPVTLGAGDSAPVIFRVNQERPGVFTVRHTAEDDLPADNQASVISPLPRPPRVLLVTRGNRFLERALRSAGEIRLEVAETLPAGEPRWDLVVVDGVVPAAWPDLNLLAIRVNPTHWFPGLNTVEAPPLVDWNSAHPLLQFVNLDNVQIASSLTTPAPAWGSVLAETTQGAVLVAGEIDGRRAIWVGFDLLASTWPLRVSFPMFIANAVDWLDPATAQAERLNVQAGEVLRVEVDPTVREFEVDLPDGTVRTQEVTPGTREAVFGSTDFQGLYRVRWSTNETRLAVRALDRDESDSTPREEIRVGSFAGTASVGQRSTNQEFWRWLAAAAFAVVMFEWWYIHRRTA